MPEYVYRDELSPSAVVYLPNVDLPATINTNLFEPVTMVGSISKVGALEIYFVATVGGTLKLKRVAGSKTTYETLNGGVACSPDVPTGPEIVTFSGGEIISLIYSGTGGTCYLTVADVSGDIVKKSR
jgi:hypothetical protein